MLKVSIEKLLLIPFFKLIEIIYISKFNNGNEKISNYSYLKELFREQFRKFKNIRTFQKSNKYN